MTNDIIKFTKMEGAGNDYIYIDALENPAPELSPTQIARLSDRRFGIGSDGLVILAPSEKGEAKMLMWNADGSNSAMCGNALRSMAYLIARKTGKQEFILESGVGLHNARILKQESGNARIEINMGAPAFAFEQIPFLPQKITPTPDATGEMKAPAIDAPFSIEDFGEIRATLVSMGNPHCVIFVPDAAKAPVEELGALIENHPAFPEKTNVEFVSREAEGLFQRTWERGSGETWACGSGACATQVASVLTGQGPLRNKIRLLGGTLEMSWSGDIHNPGDVIMTGPVREVFTGEARS